MFEKSVLARMKEQRGEEMLQVLGRVFKLLKRGVTDLDLEQKPLSVNELHKLSAIATDMNELVRLEEGKPTNITKNIALTQSEAQKLLEELHTLDPFLDYKVQQ